MAVSISDKQIKQICYWFQFPVTFVNAFILYLYIQCIKIRVLDECICKRAGTNALTFMESWGEMNLIPLRLCDIIIHAKRFRN